MEKNAAVQKTEELTLWGVPLKIENGTAKGERKETECMYAETLELNANKREILASGALQMNWELNHDVKQGLLQKQNGLLQVTWMQKRGDELLIKLNAFYLVGEEGQVELIKAVYNEGHVKLIVSSAWNVEIKQAFEKSAKLREWYEQASGIALPQKRA